MNYCVSYYNVWLSNLEDDVLGSRRSLFIYIILFVSA